MSSFMKVAVAILDDEPTLLVEWEGHEVQRYPVPVLGKKGALRFAAGEPGYRATIWRLWSTANTDDVYLASRQSAGEFKVSLHQSGDWRLQAIDLSKDNDTHFGNLDPEQGRVLHRWSRPAPDEAGWTRAVSIHVPSEHISEVPRDAVRCTDVRWIKAPPAGRTLLFEVVLVPVEAEQVVVRAFDLAPADFAAVVDVGRLAGGDIAMVLAFTEPTPSGHLAEIDNHLRERGASGASAPEEWDRSPESAPRVLTFEDDGGVLVLHDLTLGPL